MFLQSIFSHNKHFTSYSDYTSYIHVLVSDIQRSLILFYMDCMKNISNVHRHDNATDLSPFIILTCRRRHHLNDLLQTKHRLLSSFSIHRTNTTHTYHRLIIISIRYHNLCHVLSCSHVFQCCGFRFFR